MKVFFFFNFRINCNTKMLINIKILDLLKNDNSKSPEDIFIQSRQVLNILL